MANSTLLSRRAFLAASSATALALPAAAKTALRPIRSTPSEVAWRELARRMRGPVLRPWDPDFYALNQPDNLRYAGTIPQGMARCTVAEDVATAIGWSRENDIALITRSGGHSYAGYSTTTGLMIDMRLLNHVSPGGDVVNVAGGAINESIYEKLTEMNATITHGRCPSVGAAAFLLGGGIGFNMREMGLACDQVASTDLVTADGTMLRLTANETDPDKQKLFWACQGGGGGNFGISTAFTLKVTPVPKTLTVFKIGWRNDPFKVAVLLTQALAKAPVTFGSRISFSAGKDIRVNLLGQLKGTTDELMAILKDVPPSDDNGTIIREMSYWDGQDFLAEPARPTYYQERSAFVNEELSVKALETGFQHLKLWPGTHDYCDLRFFQTGGAVNDKKPGDTAFVHRKSKWLMVVGLYWTAEDNRNADLMRRNHTWQNDFYQAMLPYAGGGAYQNFPDPSLVDWRLSYYGENFFRLADAKKDVDPTRVFNFAQAI
ncbi:MAG TPA: FAD-binding oxidoreductase [Rhizomicrobium sp.]|jgi:FAD/FMN-containing dehydrogenase